VDAVSYPQAPHFRFPFTRSGSFAVYDGAGPSDPRDSKLDGGVASSHPTVTADGGSPDRGGTPVMVVEQDTADHILSCQSVIASCPVGFRNDRPEFGWAFPVFQQLPIQYDALVDALRTFEPRAPDITATEAEDLVVGSETILIQSRVETDDGDND
jgi:phage baseplate assembly protein W